MDKLKFRNNRTAFRYEALDGDDLVSQIDYLLEDDVVTITHTGTPPRYRGHGLAARLTKFALDDIQAAGLKIVPLCSFTTSFVAEHPEYACLVVPRR